MSDLGFGGLKDARYLSLATYRKTGAQVQTPVWFATAPGPIIYVYTGAGSGKVKRLRRDSRARIAPCDMRGKVTGAWTDVTATIVAGAEADTGMQLLNRKYWPWKLLLDLSARLSSRHERSVIAIRPV